MPETVFIIDTGVANVCSLQAAFARLGRSTKISGDAEELSTARQVVLPGVGTYAAARVALDEQQLVTLIQQRFASELPTLAICLGLQLLTLASEESPGVPGLGLWPATIQRFPTTVPVPHLGWNDVVSSQPERYPSGVGYFANSFCLRQPPPAGWEHATTDYAGSFYSAAWRGPVLACQFHPELSGSWGADWLARWLEGSEC